MSAVKRDYSLTVRLSPDEKAALEALTESFDLDKSATVRHALMLAIAEQPTHTLPQHGCFVPVGADSVVFPVRLSRKDDDEQ